MVLINKAINEVTVKLVYYGPGLCGKTTNLEKIYANPKLDNKGKMISMSTETDRTLFFDFMPMELGTIAGQKVRVQLYTVPGQVFYDATRKLVLRGADGVVFVADSQSSMRESNLQSLNNLRTNLRINRIDPDKVALVFQYNKRDLPNAAPVEEMTAYLQPGNAPVVEAQAMNGVGVTATLRAAVSRILENLKNHVDTTLYEEPALTAPDMTQKSGVAQHSAGTPKLSMKGDVPVPVPPPSPAPFFDTGEMPAQEAEDDDPFAHVAAVAEPEFDENAPADLFAAMVTPIEEAPVHDDRAEDEALLANARALVASLEAALERARENERAIAARLSR
ncbi:MAG: mutual gliding-motility protein MglA [Acidobacteriota bacterium]|jgi:signal recognition particle receptor subunit beta|nr:mutual gliding-motility protein MglA [Acidobacteriota bacterium]